MMITSSSDDRAFERVEHGGIKTGICEERHVEDGAMHCQESEDGAARREESEDQNQVAS